MGFQELRCVGQIQKLTVFAETGFQILMITLDIVLIERFLTFYILSLTLCGKCMIKIQTKLRPALNFW